MDNPTSDDELRTHLNALRSLPNTLVNTYTYKPLVGMTSETDPNGKTTFYEYDNFGRLKLVRDHNNNILKKSVTIILAKLQAVLKRHHREYHKLFMPDFHMRMYNIHGQQQWLI